MERAPFADNNPGQLRVEMFSLKKQMDGWVDTFPETALDAYRSLLLVIGTLSRRAVPGLGRKLEQKLSELDKRLSHPVNPETLDVTHQTVQAELSEWAEEAFLSHEANGRELKQIIDLMANALTSVTERDERYAREVVDLTARLRSITSLDDLALIRRSIIESANSLTACVERIAEDGRASLHRLAAQVEDYRSRLDKSEQLSYLDPLTGLANRRRFEEQLNGEIRAGGRFCLILIDLNEFKAVNDQFGHLAGDEVLKHFAEKLRIQFPLADLVARWGGDEFAVVITTSLRDAEARIHRIRRSALGELRIKAGKQFISLNIDASIGVVEWDGAENGPELLARADHTMYRGKRSMKIVPVTGWRENAAIAACP